MNDTAPCPHCGALIAVAPNVRGRFTICNGCGKQFYVPVTPQTVVQTPRPAQRAAANVPLGPPADPYTANNIMTCLLISAIVNFVVGAIYCITIYLAILGIPLIVLGIFECVYYGKVRILPTHELAEKSRVFGILEIIAGCFNLGSLPCGIINVVLSGKLTTQFRPPIR